MGVFQKNLGCCIYEISDTGNIATISDSEKLMYWLSKPYQQDRIYLTLIFFPPEFVRFKHIKHVIYSKIYLFPNNKFVSLLSTHISALICIDWKQPPDSNDLQARWYLLVKQTLTHACLGINSQVSSQDIVYNIWKTANLWLHRLRTKDMAVVPATIVHITWRRFKQLIYRAFNYNHYIPGHILKLFASNNSTRKQWFVYLIRSSEHRIWIEPMSWIVRLDLFTNTGWCVL
jgi:hypothetical protein